MPIAGQAQTDIQRIVVSNAKGGCGKSTLATNLAAYFAANQQVTALYDYDPQGSSMQWLKLRSDQHPAIHGVAAHRKHNNGMTRSFQLRLPQDVQYVISDTPAGTSGVELANLVQQADALIIPVLPSPIDIHAVTHFIRDLLLIGKARTHKVKIGVVANRVKHNTVMYQALRRFLKTLNIPFITSLRDTQNYAKAAQQGLGIHEMNPYSVQKDLQEWQPLLQWLQQPSEFTDTATQTAVQRAIEEARYFD